MASYQFFIAALVLVLVQQCCCQTIDGPTQITITPATLSLAPNVSDATGGQVTVQCRASSLGQGEDLFVMNIQRVLDNDPNADRTLVVGARSSQDQGNAALMLQSLQGATVSGSIGEASITLTMSMAKCADAGIYYCTATALDSNTKTKYYESFKNVTIKVSPGTITLTANPSGINSWKVNETLTILCNGVVGTVVNENNIEWVWQYQQIDPNFPSGFENWQDYSIIGDPTTDIVTDPLGASTSDCYKRQTSTLTRYLTLDDTNRQYRCYVNNRDVTSQGVDHAQMVEVGTVTESGVAPITPGPSTGAAKADVGAIVGGVIGALIVVVVIIVIVYFLVIRKRRQQDKPDPSKPADEQPPPGYSTGPDPPVTYSQPTRTSNNRFKKDKEDKGWDERDREREYRQKNSEGLHYADLDLVRRPPTDDSEDSYTPRNQPTEYASIRLF
ncbi:uncharacterized protein [Littorina saxatilis]|uniref:Ig-like domain-containing protein n=1 Tax=Littorina saxatilis TaxID=31220 RepID=A0AAN9BJJ1_9CAEN